MTGLSSDQLAWNVVVGWVGLGVEAWTGLVQGALVSWCRSLPIITLCPSHPLQPPTLHQPQHCLTTCMTFGERMLHMLMDIYKKSGGFVQTHHQHLQIASGSLVEVSTKLPLQVEVWWKLPVNFHLVKITHDLSTKTQLCLTICWHSQPTFRQVFEMKSTRCRHVCVRHTCKSTPYLA